MDIREVSLPELVAALGGGERSPIGAGQLYFIVDIGATNCRLGLFPAESKTLTIRFCKVTANSVTQLNQQLGVFEQAIGTHSQRIKASALNLPGPVTRGAIGGPIANYEGSTPKEKTVYLEKLPKKLFPKGRSVMLNDLEAGAHGVAAVADFGLFSTIFRVMWPSGAASAVLSEDDPRAKPRTIPEGHCLVVAPGTGLGIALIEQSSTTGERTVLPLEFGHTAVQSESEEEFLAIHRKELGRSVEYDDVCSGRGLERLYKYVAAGESSSSVSAQTISEGAKRGDPTCLRAMELYNRLLMRFCSQLTMGFVAGSIVLCGDNVVKNSFSYSNGAPSVVAMQRAFLEHSMERMGFMSRATMLRQAESVNLNLVGCVHACKHLAPAEARSKL